MEEVKSNSVSSARRAEMIRRRYTTRVRSRGYFCRQKFCPQKSWEPLLILCTVLHTFFTNTVSQAQVAHTPRNWALASVLSLDVRILAKTAWKKKRESPCHAKFLRTTPNYWEIRVLVNYFLIFPFCNSCVAIRASGQVWLGFWPTYSTGTSMFYLLVRSTYLHLLNRCCIFRLLCIIYYSAGLRKSRWSTVPLKNLKGFQHSQQVHIYRAIGP